MAVVVVVAGLCCWPDVVPSGHLDRPVKTSYVDVFRDAAIDMLLGGRMLVSLHS